MYNIAILASGSGTNAENIVRTFNQGSLLRVVLVITDQPDAGVAARMEPFGIPVKYIPGPVWRKEPQQIVALLRENDIDLVVLAGFMRLIAAPIVEAFPGRILNIHPALLPAYGGKGMYGHHVHEAVIAAGEKQSGVTVHYVDEHYDHGTIVLQETVDITPDDTPATLEQKIHTLEYSIYPRAIVKALDNLNMMTPPPVPDVEPVTVQHPAEEQTVNLNVEDVEPSKVENVGAPVPPPAPPAPPANDVNTLWAEALHMPYTPPQTPQGVPTQTPPPAFNTPQATALPAEPMPRNWFLLSVLVTILCCFIPGILAIIYSTRVSNLYYKGDIEGSRRASRNAEIWIIVSFCLGVLSATLYMPMTIVTQMFN